MVTDVRRGRFAPTILVVDDDKLVTRRWRREFHNATSLGVVIANSLEQAANIVEHDSVQIDAVVSDLLFDHGTGDSSRHLETGVDFLTWFSNRGGNIPLFVMSATENMVNFREQLEHRDVPIEQYFDKFVAGYGNDPAWLRIQRAILTRKFHLEAGEVDQSVEAMTQAMARLQLSVRTYIQELPDYPQITVLKPIEAICVAQDGGIKAYAPSLGLLTSVRGETVSEAIDELSLAIGSEAEFTMARGRSTPYSDYAERIAKRFEEYLALNPEG